MAGYIIKVTMENTHPPVWRRLLIPDRILFSDLHQILQAAFGWEDDHLHEFSFPQSDFLIIQSSEASGFAHECVLETEALVDDYLQDYNWIRYTYDFGDDWKHKIVYEKTDTGYESRFAQVLKYKGDNFAEDSGGVFREYIAREQGEEYDWLDYHTEFDLYKTNENLRNRTFPVRKRKKKSGAARQKRAAEMKELSKLLDQLFKEASKNSHGPSLRDTFQSSMENIPEFPFFDVPPISSGIDKDLEEWNEFWEEKRESFKESLEEKAPRKKKEQYEQMTLPFVDTVKEENVNYGIYLTGPTVPASIHMKRCSAKSLEDFCRYLQVKPDSKSKKKNIETYIRIITEHPEYLLLAFTQEEAEVLWKMQTMPHGLIDPEPEFLEETVIKALYTGIMTCSIHRKKRKQTAEIAFTLEGAEIAAAAQKLPYRKKYREILKLEEALQKSLTYYGYIEIDEWCRITRKQAAHKLSDEAFRRYVYWHLTLNQYIRTATNAESGSSIAFMPGIDPERIYRTIEEYGRNLPWRELTGNEYALWNLGIDAFYDCWSTIAELVTGNTQNQEEAEYHIEHLFTEVLNGAAVDEICEIYLEAFPAESLTESVIIWKPVYDAIHKTAIPGLKGHSREEYRSLTGKEGPAAFRSHLTKKQNIGQTTHICKMEPEVQKKIFSLMESWDKESAAAFKTYIIECGGNNEEMLYLLSTMYVGIGQPEEALRVLEKLKKIHKGSRDDILAYINMVMDMIDEKNASVRHLSANLPVDEEKVVPFRRNSRKIMPNDPCPCGSGRKYKHCCGKNR